MVLLSYSIGLQKMHPQLYILLSLQILRKLILDYHYYSLLNKTLLHMLIINNPYHNYRWWFLFYFMHFSIKKGKTPYQSDVIELDKKQLLLVLKNLITQNDS